MRLFEIEKALNEGKALRHTSWSVGNYMYITYDLAFKVRRLVRVHKHYCEYISLSTFDEYADYDYVEVTDEYTTDLDKLTEIQEQLKQGFKFTKPEWNNAYIYCAKDETGYEDDIRMYWKQQNGNIYICPYVFGLFNDMNFKIVNEDEVRKIWGYL